jgi:hypothetical protein
MHGGGRAGIGQTTLVHPCSLSLIFIDFTVAGRMGPTRVRKRRAHQETN